MDNKEQIDALEQTIAEYTTIDAEGSDPESMTAALQLAGYQVQYWVLRQLSASDDKERDDAAKQAAQWQLAQRQSSKRIRDDRVRRLWDLAQEVDQDHREFDAIYRDQE